MIKKQKLRQQILLNRSLKSVSDRSLLDEKLLAVLTQWLEETLSRVPASTSAPVVAGFVPVGDEPGATLGTRFLDSIHASVRNSHGEGQLLLPVCPPGPPTALEWGAYTGALVKGKYGLLEPDCAPAGGPLPAITLAKADIILLPGVAGDPATGMRMGRGAGYYDRSLAVVGEQLPPTALIVHPDEVVTGVPYDAHDQAVDVILTADGPIVPTRA